VFVGFGNSEPTFNLSRIIADQLTLMGSYVMPIFMYWDLVDLIREHGLPIEDMITHRYPIEQAPEAFELFDSGRTGKVIFEWPD
jgi:propanol-preferring alcohol dehydrogenase